jgi:arginyl-tRNA synthetase
MQWSGSITTTDAGRQMRLLGESVRARYLEIVGEKGEFPEGGYKEEYIREYRSKDL